MTNRRLGVNIDHVATIRNVRGENYPTPLRAAKLAQKSGANSITIHLREDRRHIRDNDLKLIKKKIKIPVNLEIASTQEMLRIATKIKPHFVCLVPEKRNEITAAQATTKMQRQITSAKAHSAQARTTNTKTQHTLLGLVSLSLSLSLSLRAARIF